MLFRYLGLLLAVALMAACTDLPVRLPYAPSSPAETIAPISGAEPAPVVPVAGPLLPVQSSVAPSPSVYQSPSPQATVLNPTPLATTVIAASPTLAATGAQTTLLAPGKPDAWSFPTPAPDARNLRVARVVDGDTLHLEGASGTFGVRLIGVDTPETVHPTKGVECFGPEASAFTKQLAGRTIKFGTDPTQGEFDRYDRALGYVWLEDRLINQELIVRGLAREYTYSKPYRYQKEFREAQSSAQAKQVGIWSATCGATSAPAATAKPDAGATQPGNEAVSAPSPSPSPEGACGPGEIWVNSYTRKDGTVVRGYCRKR